MGRVIEQPHLLHYLVEVGWVIGRRLGAIRVAVGVKIEIQTDINLPANFGSSKQILLFFGKLVVPLGNNLREGKQSSGVCVGDRFAR